MQGLCCSSSSSASYIVSKLYNYSRITSVHLLKAMHFHSWNIKSDVYMLVEFYND